MDGQMDWVERNTASRAQQSHSGIIVNQSDVPGDVDTMYVAM